MQATGQVSPISSRTAFTGETVDQWIEHFTFTTKMRDAFKDLAVSDLADIGIIYEDEELLARLKATIRPLDYRKFKDAKDLSGLRIERQSFTGESWEEGVRLQAWYQHFKFSSKALDFFGSQGVGVLGDMVLIYDDAELLSSFKETVPPLEYKKFLLARKLTPSFLPPQSVLDTRGINYDLEGDALSSAANSEHASVIGDSQVVPDDASVVSSEDESTVNSDAASSLSDSARSDSERHSESSNGGSRSRRQTEEDDRETARRIRKIQRAVEKVEHLADIDLCFIVDCTGSMKPYLDELIKHIMTICHAIQSMHADCTIRLAFVGYRDVMELRYDRLVVHDFNPSCDAFRDVVRGQEAAGGGDEAEDIAGGLDKVISLKWKAPNRVLIHIGDAPCHGVKFHGGQSSDHFPDGDPRGLKIEKLLEKIMDMNIRYAFTKINYKTDMMIEQFNDICSDYAKSREGGDHKEFMTKDFITTLPGSDVEKIMSFILAFTVSVHWESTSITLSTESSSSEKSRRRHFDLDPNEPADWEAVNTEGALHYTMVKGVDLETIVFDSLKSVNDLPEDARLSLKIAPKPFAKGAEKVAFFASVYQPVPPTIPPTVALTPYIAKDFISKPKDRTMKSYEVALSRQRIAIEYAKEFNKRKPTNCPSIQFADISIIQRNTVWPEQPYMILESRLDCVNNVYEKYNTNNGGVFINPTVNGTDHSAVQAFCHFTYSRSGGQVIVVDCQGVFEQHCNNFCLTDPAVHCQDVNRFGKTNLGIWGIHKFFKKHICNDICKNLQLLRPDIDALQALAKKLAEQSKKAARK